MRPVDIAVPAWFASRRQGEDARVDARAPVRRQRNGAGRRRDRHVDRRGGTGRRSVGDRVGKAVRTAVRPAQGYK